MIDRPLTEEEQCYVRTLSRRVHLTPAQAIFTYSYGDFPGNALALLETHFDAMLYTANWGSRELAFRFPRALIDLERLQRYYWAADEITLKSSEQHVVLDIHFQDIDPGDWFFAIDADLIARAALSSPPLERMDDQIDRWVAQVPDAERAAWLVRLARGEPHLDVQFLRRLREIAER